MNEQSNLDIPANQSPFSTLRPVNDIKTGKVKKETHKKIKKIAYFSVQDMTQALRQAYRIYEKHPNESRRHVDILGYEVAITSLKIKTFVEHADHLICSNHDCGLVPAYFTLEQPKEQKNKQRAYLSLYGVGPGGFEVEFTHDHTKARCFGGTNTLDNTTPMCFDCNQKKSRIETYTHNKTKSLLRDYLQQQNPGNEKLNLQFLIHHAEKSKAVMGETIQFERHLTFPVAEVIPLLRAAQTQHISHQDLGGYSIAINSKRLNAFATSDMPCCENPKCQMKATFFAVETPLVKHAKRVSPTLNLYGQKDGQDISFHHHLSINYQSHLPEIEKVITLCKVCKEDSLHHDLKRMGQNIQEYLQYAYHPGNRGPSSTHHSPSKKHRRSEVPQDQDKQNKLKQAAQLLASQLQMPWTDFIEYCQTKGEEMHFPDMPRRKNSKTHVIMDITGMNAKGAGYYRKLASLVYSSPTLPSLHHLEQKIKSLVPPIPDATLAKEKNRIAGL